MIPVIKTVTVSIQMEALCASAWMGLLEMVSPAMVSELIHGGNVSIVVMHPQDTKSTGSLET